MPLGPEWSLNAIFRELKDAVVIANTERRIVSINPAATRTFGYGTDELTGRKAAVLYAEYDDFRNQGRIVFNTHEVKKSSDSHLPFRRKDGSIFFGRLTGSQIVGDDGVIAGFLGIIHDQTQMVEARRERERVEKILTSALETIPDGFVIYDENDRLVLCNEAYRRIYNKSAEAIVPGARFEDILKVGLRNGQYPEAGDTGADRMKWLKERLEAHADSNTSIVQQVDKDRWLRIDERRTEQGYTVGIRADISELKAAERDLAVANKALQAKSAALQDFAAIVSHDLQAPLRHLAIYADQLQQGGARPDEMRANARRIVKSAGRMRELVSGLFRYCSLSYARVEAEPLELEAVLALAVDNLGPMISDADADIAIDTDVWVLGDRYLLVQVFQNLIENAVKFCRKPSPEVRIDTAGDGRTWRVSVTDNGPGIAATFGDRVFQIFKRLEKRESDIPGTGIGLSVCKRIIESHGGEIWLDSGYSAGARFQLTLPAA